MQNLIDMFTFSAFDRIYPFSENLVQKMKIVSLKSAEILQNYANMNLL